MTEPEKPETWTSTLLILALLAATFAVAFMCARPE